MASKKEGIAGAKKYNAARRDRAEAESRFVVADPDKKYAKTESLIHLSSAVKKVDGELVWKTSDDYAKANQGDKSGFLYIIGYQSGNKNVVVRVAGDEADIRAVLADSKLYTAKSIDSLIAEYAITGENYNADMLNEFQAELANEEAVKKAAKEEVRDNLPSAAAVVYFSQHLTGDSKPVIGTLEVDASGRQKLVHPPFESVVKSKPSSAEEKLIHMLHVGGVDGKRIIDVTNVGKTVGKKVNDDYRGANGSHSEHLAKNHYYIPGIPIQSNDYDNYVMAVNYWATAYPNHPNGALSGHRLPANYQAKLAALKASAGSAKATATTPSRGKIVLKKNLTSKVIGGAKPTTNKPKTPTPQEEEEEEEDQ